MKVLSELSRRHGAARDAVFFRELYGGYGDRTLHGMARDLRKTRTAYQAYAAYLPYSWRHVIPGSRSALLLLAACCF